MSRRALTAVVAAVLLVGCDNSPRSLNPVVGPTFDISEGRSGGNPDIFFGQPLANTPQPGDLNFDAGASNSALAPNVRICETDGTAGPAGCVVDVTQQFTGSATGLPMSYSSGSELYSANWQTKNLVLSKDYRIEIWGVAFSTAAEKAALDPRWLFGWRDVRNAPSVSSCTAAQAFCLINYGQTIPVKVRIEQYVFCPVTRNCAVQFVSAGTNANLQVQLDPLSGAPNAQLFIPGQTGTNFALAFEPCSAAEDAAVSAAIDLPTFGPCLKTVTTFSAALAAPAIISICDDLDPSGFGLSEDQEHLLGLHHITSDFSRAQALPEAWQCGTPTSGVASSQPNDLKRFLYAVRDGVWNLFTPRPLIAATMIDRGGGGESPFIMSFFKLALPAKFEYEFAGDANQSGLAGSSYTLRTKVTDLLGAPVKNARVRWAAIAPPNDGATVLGSAPTAPILTDANGIAQTTVTLASSTGYNVFRAFGRGIADDRSSGCTIPASTPAACNGPRSTYDPFMPFHVPEFDPAGTEEVVDIAENTRILYTVFGCVPGYGTATVNGTFSAAEWACANTYPFTAKVSGGSTPATLYVMNDGANLYLAVRLARGPGDKVNTLQFNFDNNNSWATNGTGAAETGDDVLSFDAVTGFKDAYLTLKCSNSSQSSCWATDVSSGGTNDGQAAFTNAGGFTTYEVSHPLNTANDAHDFSLVGGGKVGLFLTLQTGAGAAGNTQWPGFRSYLAITIQQ